MDGPSSGRAVGAIMHLKYDLTYPEANTVERGGQVELSVGTGYGARRANEMHAYRMAEALRNSPS